MKLEKMTETQLVEKRDELKNLLAKKEKEKKAFPPTTFIGILYMTTTISKYKNQILTIERELERRREIGNRMRTDVYEK